MKSRSSFMVLVLTAVLLLSFDIKHEIPECYLSFKSATNLTQGSLDRLPETSEKSWTVPTDKGDVEITRTDGYRILYKNDKGAPFVNLKVELSAKNAYQTDQKNLLENLRYMNSHSSNMETKDLIDLESNGFKIYGLSRGTIESGSNLGTFAMFPGDDLTVYFYFNNLKAEYRNFKSLEDYKKQRDTFIDEYTTHLKTCISRK